MNTFNITDFYKRCDALVRDWQYKKTPNNDPFLTKEKSSNVLLQKNYWNLMPEPFWGNPENCYAVIINLNPGYSKYDKEYIGRDVITKKLRNGYSDFAITNPYFIDASFHPAATAWWSNRLNWMHKAFGCFNDPRYPFMLELCPWHSKKWAETGITTFTEEQKEYIKQNVLAPAAFASKENNRPIISIGKAEKIYQQLGFKLVKFWGPGKHEGLDWPLRKDMGKKNVHFDYYRHQEDEKIKLINIWMKGSNHTPSDEFLDIERYIIRNIILEA